MALEKQINIVVKETGLDAVQKQVNKLDNSLEDLSKTNSNVVKSMGESSNAVLDNGGAMGLLNDATGGLAMTVKDAVEASVLFTKSQKLASIQQAIYSTVVGTSTGAMKLFRIALVATGIGALVVGLGLLIANFDKVKKVVLNLIPGLANVGEFVENLMNGFTDFIGVTSEAERALASLTEQADKSLAMNKKFMAEEGDLVNKYTKAKIDAKNAYNEAIKEEGANQKKLAERLNRELLAIDKMHNEDLAKERQSKQDKIDEENKNLSEKEKARLEKQRADKEKADADADKKAEEKIKSDAEKAIALDEEIKDAIFTFDEFKNQQTEAQAEKDAEYGANKIARIAYEKDQEIAIEQELKRQKEVIADANMKIATKTVELLSQLAGKNKALQKAGIIASAGIGIYSVIKDTQAANMAAIAPPPLGLGPIAGIGLQTKNTIQGALSVASITAASAKALSSVGGGGSVGGGSMGSGSSTSAPSFNLVQGTGTNQIAQGLSQQGAPIKAYVVSSDVSTSQSLDRNIVSEASLG